MRKEKRRPPTFVVGMYTTRSAVEISTEIPKNITLKMLLDPATHPLDIILKKQRQCGTVTDAGADKGTVCSNQAVETSQIPVNR